MSTTQKPASEQNCTQWSAVVLRMAGKTEKDSCVNCDATYTCLIERCRQSVQDWPVQLRDTVWNLTIFRSFKPHSDAPINLRHLVPDYQLLTATEQSRPMPFCFSMDLCRRSHFQPASAARNCSVAFHSMQLRILHWYFATFHANTFIRRIRRWIFEKCTLDSQPFSTVQQRELAARVIKHGLFFIPSCS